MGLTFGFSDGEEWILRQAVVVGGDDAAGDGLSAGGFPRDDWRLDFVTGAGESFSVRIFDGVPDWRKVGWIVGGLAFLFLLGLVTMWWRGVD